MPTKLNLSHRNWLSGALPLAALSAAAWSYLDVKQRELIFAPVKQESAAARRADFSYEETWITYRGTCPRSGQHEPPLSCTQRQAQSGLCPSVRAGERSGEETARFQGSKSRPTCRAVSPRTAAAGAALHAWWAPAKQADAPAILFLHGARWNLSWYVERIKLWHQMGFSVLAIDYRGFGRSAGGLPTEASVYADARIAWAHLKRLAPGAHFLYGHSLGGAIAIELASRSCGASGVMIESSFTSIRDMAAALATRWLPLDSLLTQRFDSLSKVAGLQAPVLFMHGTADAVVPAAMSENLYRTAPQPKQLVVFDGAGHSDIPLKSAHQYRMIVSQFVQASIGARAA